METGLRWLLLVAVLKGVQCQSVEESGGRLVTPGTPLTLTCTVSGIDLSSNAVGWVRHTPGKGLEWIGYIFDTIISYATWAKGRFTISKTSSTVDLEITSPTTEDTATYFCYRGLEMLVMVGDLWGQGTLVTVSSDPAETPGIYPLGFPCPVSDGNSQYVVVGCLIRGFFPPGPLSVSWTVNGENVSAYNFPPAQSGTSGPYTACSELILPVTQCLGQKSAACHVEYNSVINESLPVPFPDCCPANSCCTCPSSSSRNLISGCQPSLSLQRPDLGDLLLGRDASLTCTLSGLKNPEDAVFTWEPTNGNEPVQQRAQRDLSGCYSVSSVLPSSAETWKARTEFTCTVTHPEIDSGSLTATISRGVVTPPQVHLLPPPSEELALNEQVTLTCLVRGFSPKDVLVSWRHQGQEVPEDSFLVWKSMPESSQDKATYAITSLLRVPAEDWNQGDTYSCMVGHEGLAEHFTQKTIDRLAGKPTHVNVSVVVADVEAVCY